MVLLLSAQLQPEPNVVKGKRIWFGDKFDFGGKRKGLGGGGEGVEVTLERRPEGSVRN